MAVVLQNLRKFTRASLVLAGLGSIGWAAVSSPVYWAEAPLAETALRIVSAEAFRPAQLEKMKLAVTATSDGLSPTALDAVAVIRLRLLEAARADGNVNATDSSAVESSVKAALARDPGNSFLWLIAYWLQDPAVRMADRSLRLLQMSYSLGPNEGWVAVRRNRLAMEVFTVLPDELAQSVVSEFAGLVESELYKDDAADILAGPGWTTREKLLAAVAHADETRRRELARALKDRNRDGTLVPGGDVACRAVRCR